MQRNFLRFISQTIIRDLNKIILLFWKFYAGVGHKYLICRHNSLSSKIVFFSNPILFSKPSNQALLLFLQARVFHELPV